MGASLLLERRCSESETTPGRFWTFLSVVAMLAAYLPGRSAARVDPLAVLRMKCLRI